MNTAMKSMADDNTFFQQLLALADNDVSCLY